MGLMVLLLVMFVGYGVALGLVEGLVVLLNWTAWAGIFVSAGWVLVLLGGLAGLRKAGERSPILRRLAYFVELFAFYTVLLQGVVLGTLVLSTIGMLLSDVPVEDIDDFLFGGVVISLWFVGILVGIGIGAGIPGWIGGRTRWLESRWDKVLLYGVTIPAGLWLALAFPLVGERLLQSVYETSGIMRVLMVVLAVYVPLSVVGMGVMFDPPVMKKEIKDTVGRLVAGADLYRSPVITRENAGRVRLLAELAPGPVWKIVWGTNGGDLTAYTPEGVYRYRLAALASTPDMAPRKPSDESLVSPDGRFSVVVGGSSKQFVDLEAHPRGTQLFRLYESYVTQHWAFGMSQDGAVLAGCNLNGELWVWDTGSGEGGLAARVPDVFFHGAAVSADGRWAAVGGGDKGVYVWDTAAQTLAPKFMGHSGAIMCAGFGLGGVLATGGQDKQVRLWDPAGNGAALAVLAGHQRDIRAVAFNPAGTLLASASGDGTVRLWGCG